MPAVDQRSNEITAVPELLRVLVVSEAVVTIDSMGCQQETADPIPVELLRLVALGTKVADSARRVQIAGPHEVNLLGHIPGSRCNRRRAVVAGGRPLVAGLAGREVLDAMGSPVGRLGASHRSTFQVMGTASDPTRLNRIGTR
jgi:predicted transposase YbfD/YdcC